MPTSIAVVATDTATRERLAALVPSDTYSVIQCAPNEMPEPHPALFIVALPGVGTPEAALIEQLRANDSTANIPIVIASALPMVELQSLPYASDWTVAIVEEPVQAQVLLETMQFLLGNNA
jgi:CheY-like chemotaxis protein